MNPLLKKEIRLLLPAWLAVLLLEMVAPWLTNEPDLLCLFAPVFLFFGIILLSVDSFGREFSLGTFSALMAQPVDRQRLWQTKITLLIAAAMLVFAVYFASCELRLHLAVTDGQSVWHFNPKIISQDYAHAMLASVAVLFIALTGGLWTALLLRQVAAAFWITFLVPVGLCLLLMLMMSQLFKSASDLAANGVFYGAAGLYIAASFWLAHRLFFQAQDAGWSGGVISFDRWRYFEKTGQRGDSHRRYRPTAALLKKEFQLNSISFFCAGALLAVHAVVFYFRMDYTKAHPNTTAAEAADYFWVMWLVMPLVISCTTVAEERKLGVADSQLCLPVSRRRQFALKFIPTMIFGVLLGGVMPVLLENLAGQLGIPSDSFKPGSHSHTDFGDGLFWFQVGLVIQAAGLAAAGFLASTLARNFLQALSLAIVGIIGLCLIGPCLIMTRHLAWLIILGVPVMSMTLVWLMYRTFSYYHEGSRLWRRYLVVVLGAWIAVQVSGGLIYDRVWERRTPVEPAHGPAVWSLDRRPAARRSLSANNLQVSLPDGRVWSGYLAPGPHWLIGDQTLWTLRSYLLLPPPPRLAHPQFIDGGDWVSLTAGSMERWNNLEYFSGWEEAQDVFNDLRSRETVGIRGDGTLWVSEQPGRSVWNNSRLVQFGSETNWQEVAGERSPASVLLLKKNGTLWHWGNAFYDPGDFTRPWKGLRTCQPQQIGTNTDWRHLLCTGWGITAQKADGSLWDDWEYIRNVKDRPRNDVDGLVRDGQFSWAGLNHQRLDETQFAITAYGVGANIRPDGTLWIWGPLQWNGVRDPNGVPGKILQSGRETNWVAVALSRQSMVALKADGTLWHWGLTSDSRLYAQDFTSPPQQLGGQHDWVALMHAREGIVSLAADGSLWYWRDNGGYSDPWKLTKPSEKPVALGNILASADK